MLPEQRATSYAHDPALHTVVVVSETSRPTLHGEQPARLLLDDASHLVGVDVAPDSQDRFIVMLGPHEKVARTMDAKVNVDGGGRTITLHGNVAKTIPPGANPYVY
jgi:hypothetical protein